MKEYRITVIKILYQMSAEIFTLLVVIYTFYYLFLSDRASDKSLENLAFSFIFCVVFFGLLLAFPLFMNYNHYKYDCDTLLIIDSRDKKIFYKHDSMVKEFLISDITYITKYNALVPAFIIHYYKVFLKDGTYIDVTSLLMPTLNKELKNIKMGQEHTYDLILRRKKKKDIR